MWWIITWLLKENSGRYEFWNSETLAQFPRATGLRYRKPLSTLLSSSLSLSSSKFSRCTLCYRWANVPTYQPSYLPSSHVRIMAIQIANRFISPEGFGYLEPFSFPPSLSLSFLILRELGTNPPPFSCSKNSFLS